MPLEFTRVSKQNLCPICRHEDFCEIGDRAVLCQRVGSDRPNNRAAGGWFHFFYQKPATTRLAHKPARFITPLKEAESLLSEWKNKFSQKNEIDRLAGSLSVCGESISELECTKCDIYQFTIEKYGKKIICTWRDFFGFPMRDDTGKIIGIRTRDWAGNKKAITGSRAGLFYSESPEALELLDNYPAAFLCEGPTDCAAALTLGFFGIGRPNCQTGNEFVVKLLKRLNIRRVVIAANNDGLKVGNKRPGLDGALQIQKQLGVPSYIWLPASPIKDLRQFVGAGGTREMILDDLKTKVFKR